jgi:hypothetical protein
MSGGACSSGLDDMTTDRHWKWEIKPYKPVDGVIVTTIAGAAEDDPGTPKKP